MLERYFKAWKTLRRLRFGPSGPYIDGFATVLERDGYAKAITKHHLRAALRNGEQNESDLALAAGATAANSPLRNLPITQELYEISIWPQAAFSQRATWPPSAAVRQRSIAFITFNCSRLRCPRLASRQAGP